MFCFCVCQQLEFISWAHKDEVRRLTISLAANAVLKMNSLNVDCKEMFNGGGGLSCMFFFTLNTVCEATEKSAVCVCVFGWGFSVVWTFQFPLHFLTLKAEPWPLTNSSPLPTESPSCSTPTPFPYWRAWKGSTAYGQSSGGLLLNCLLSGG